jgi:hypothetical protein
MLLGFRLFGQKARFLETHEYRLEFDRSPTQVDARQELRLLLEEYWRSE